MRDQLPSGWTVRKLGEVLSQVERPVRVDQNATYQMLGVRWYAAGCHTHSQMAGDALVTPGLSLLKADDVVYNKMWATKGAFAVAQDCHAGLHGTSEYPMFACCGIDPNYVRRWLERPQFWGEAAGLCKGTTNRARLAPRDFLRLVIVVPPLPEQRAIAEALRSVDDAVEQSRAVIEQLGRVKKALVQELLTRGLPGRHTRFKPTPVGEIPVTWEFVRLGDLGTWRCGHTPSMAEPTYWGGSVPWASAKDMKALRLMDTEDHITDAALSSGVTMAAEGSLLIVVRGLILQRRLPVAMLTRPMAFNQDLRSLTCGPGIRPAYALQALIASAPRLLALCEYSTHGTKRLPSEELLDHRIPLPPLDEQEGICRLIAPLEVRTEAEHRSVAAMAALKRGLMQDLLTGRRRWKGASITHAGGGD